MKLKDRVAVITGAASGIGRAGALEFAREGARVVAVDVNRAGIEETTAQIRAAGGTATPVPADVADPAAVQALVRSTLESFGSVHVLFNNAAIQVNKTVEDTTPEEWSRQMAVNVGGIFLCSKYFLPHLRNTRGAIVNMSSVNGFFVEPMCAGYCATKGAIIALTKAMAATASASTASVRVTSTPGWRGATSRRSPIRRPPVRRPADCTRSGASAVPKKSHAPRCFWRPTTPRS
jgi:NAD(P)-dependent dehydrogenase (short-subunit alcohol dehydrogenase family)